MGANSVNAVLVTLVLFTAAVGAHRPVQDCARCDMFNVEEDELIYCRLHINPWDPPSHQDIEHRCNDCGGTVAVLPNDELYRIRRIRIALSVSGVLQKDEDEVLADDETSATTGHMTAITIRRLKVKVKVVHFQHVIGFLCNVSHSDLSTTSKIESWTTAAEEIIDEMSTTTATMVPPTTTSATTTTMTLPTTTRTTTTMTTRPTTEEDDLLLSNGVEESQKAMGQSTALELYALPIALGVVMVLVLIGSIIGGVYMLVRMRRRTPRPDPLTTDLGSPVDNPVYFSPQALTTGVKSAGGSISFGSNLYEKAMSGSLKKY